MENILAQAKKVAEEAEVFLVSSEGTSVQFESNRLKHIHSRQGNSVALRITRQGRTGYATSTDLADSQNLVDMAEETAHFGMKAEYQFPSPVSYPQIAIYDPGIESVSIDDMVKLGEELIDTVKAHTPDIMCEGGVSRAVTCVRILNSRGGQAEYRRSSFNLGIEGTLVRDTDMLFVGESESSCHPLSQARTVAEVVLWQLEMARNQASVSSQLLPVVFTPQGVASALISPLVAAFNGKTVLQGASPVGNKAGQRVFDEKLSLWDDPILAYRPESRPCDDEGVASQRTQLIGQGTVTGFLYDLQTAALARTSSTGNGSRSGGGLPAPSPSAFIIAPGDTTFDEMVGDVKEGLVIEWLMGAGQGNVLGGDFSGNVLLGYKIESGKIVGRVKNTVVSGNIYQAFKQIAAVSSDTRWVGSSLQAPYLYFPSLSVASKV